MRRGPWTTGLLLTVTLAVGACSTGAASAPVPATVGDTAVGQEAPQTSDASASSATVTVDGVAVTLSGGHETDPADEGRPVALIAAALGVPTEVFRQAFSEVTPAQGRGPTGEEAQANKAALRRVLDAYGITNDQLDAVSDHYRYRQAAGERWPTTPASAEAVVVDGRVTAITVTAPGSGYSSPPTVTITGAPGVTATATLHLDTDVAANGSIAAIALT